MNKIKASLLATIAAAIGYFVLQNVPIPGLGKLPIGPQTTQTGTDAQNPGSFAPPLKRTGETIRIASFNIQVFGETKAQNAPVMDVLARIVRNFDVVAIQEIRAKSQDVVPYFVEQINSAGRRYDYVIGERLGRSNSKEQYAFIFDTQSVEVDRGQLYTVADPDDLLHREPLVALFRVRGPAPEQAFTFTLANIHTDPDEVPQELGVLDDVFMAVRNDGRNEDDIIILGDFNADDRHLGELGQISGMMAVIAGLPTNTKGNAQYDNILFTEQATREFTGRGGVFDFMREYNLTQEQAEQVSDHLPVWAEFSIYEGGQGGRFAGRETGIK
ncbi:MAG TPA: endonuclease/exonuclease/phosphatase family protein [Pirellulaceae bacterium]|nr:endonuclease/exonuclease/phosphatase family protein [Pirellulaceae bacterium]